MASLREEIETAQRLDLVPVFLAQAGDQHTHITGLGVDIATNVDNALGAELAKLLEKIDTGALTGRIDDDETLVRREGDVLEQNISVGGDEPGIGDAVDLGVLAGGLDSRRVDVDAQHRTEQGAETNGEQARPAIGVEEVFDRRRPRGSRWQAVVAHILDEGWQDGVVVLEERVGARHEGEFAHVLGREGVCVRRVRLGVPVRRVGVDDLRLGWAGRPVNCG